MTTQDRFTLALHATWSVLRDPVLTKKNLSSNDLEVLQLFYGLNGYPQMNRHEISALIGIGQDQISRIKTRALNRLKRLIDKN